jgi:hypothetical protein
MKTILKLKIVIPKKASKELKSLKHVFEELLRVHQDYIDSQFDEKNSDYYDHPYWYTERPNVGLLAAAVWRSGGRALEEFRTNKNGDGKPVYGRCDLWLEAKGTSFECEAKRHWVDLVSKKTCSPESIFNDKLDGLEAAKNDVLRLEKRKGLALCFVNPGIRSSDGESLATKVREWRKSIESKSSRWDALVWIGVSPKQKAFSNYLKKGWLYAGLLLVIKELR